MGIESSEEKALKQLKELLKTKDLYWKVIIRPCLFPVRYNKRNIHYFCYPHESTHLPSSPYPLSSFYP